MVETIKEVGGDWGKWHNLSDEPPNPARREAYKAAFSKFGAPIIRQLTIERLNEK